MSRNCSPRQSIIASWKWCWCQFSKRPRNWKFLHKRASAVNYNFDWRSTGSSWQRSNPLCCQVACGTATPGAWDENTKHMLPRWNRNPMKPSKMTLSDTRSPAQAPPNSMRSPFRNFRLWMKSFGNRRLWLRVATNWKHYKRLSSAPLHRLELKYVRIQNLTCANEKGDDWVTESRSWHGPRNLKNFVLKSLAVLFLVLKGNWGADYSTTRAKEHWCVPKANLALSWIHESFSHCIPYIPYIPYLLLRISATLLYHLQLCYSVIS